MINQAVKPVHTNPPTHTHVYDADGYAEKTSSSARHAPKYKAVGNAWNTPTFTHESNMLRAGANGYLLKDSAEMELALALESVMADQVYLSPRISGHLVKAALTGTTALDSQSDIPLTARQKEILRFIADGKATKEIAWELGLSAKTVESHRAQIMERLEIRDIAGLIRYAFKHGLTEL